MPKKLGSADLAGIYGDPQRAEREAREDLENANARLRSYWQAQVSGVGLPVLSVIANRDANNAKFKLERAKAAERLGEIKTAPILAGFSADELKWWIAGGLLAAAVLVFT